MNKNQIELKQNILKSLHREKNKVLGEREKELSEIDTRLMLVRKNQFKLDDKIPKKQIKLFRNLGLAFVKINNRDYLASWDKEDRKDG